MIDPGPLLDDHVAALLAAVEGEEVSHILLTHTHADHSPAAAPLKAATGAPTYAFGPHGSGKWAVGVQVEEGGDMDPNEVSHFPCGADLRHKLVRRFSVMHSPSVLSH